MGAGSRHQGVFRRDRSHRVDGPGTGRVADKQLLALVKAFLKAGVMTPPAAREDTHRYPAGRDLSPLLANIALSALDEHFDRVDTTMDTWHQRQRRKRRG